MSFSVKHKLTTLSILFLSIVFSLSVFFVLELKEINRPFKTTIIGNIEKLTRVSRLNDLADEIQYYDEALTQSARNYAYTQDDKWLVRYLKIEPKLETSIRQAFKLGDEEDKSLFSAIDAANLDLVDMEYKSIELVKEGRQEEAIEMLESAEYWNKKTIYQQGLEKYNQRQGQSHSEAILKMAQIIEYEIYHISKLINRNIIIIALSATFILFIVLGINIYLHRSIAKPLKELHEVTNKISKGGLNVNINPRTKEINNEIGRLAIAYDVMVNRLKETTVSKNKLVDEVNEHKKSKEKVSRLNSILRTISNINQMIIKELDPKTLIEKACREFTKSRGYQSAWIVLLDREKKYLTAAASNMRDDFDDFINKLKDGKMPRCINKAISIKKMFGVESPHSSCQDCPLYKGHRDVVTLVSPLLHESVVYGILTVAIPKEIEVNQEEKALFKEVAGDIALALHHIETEKRQEEIKKQLKISEARYKALFDDSRDAIMVIAPPDYKFVAANQAALDMFGVATRDKFFTLGSWDVSPKRQSNGKLSINEAKKKIQIAFDEGSAYFEWTHKRLNGRPFPATVLLSKLEIDDEVYIQATVRNIMDQKFDEARLLNASNDLKERMKELNCFYEFAKIVEDEGVNFNGILDKTTRLLKSATNEPENMCVRITFGGVEHKSDNCNPTDLKIKSNIIVNNEVAGFLEVSYTKKVTGSREVFLKEEKNLIEAMAERLGRIAERVKSKNALEESEQRFHSMVDNIPGVIYRCANDKDWTMEFISDEIENLTGYPPSDFIDNKKRTFTSVIEKQDKEKVNTAIQRATEKKEAYFIDYRLRHKNGNTVWVNEKGRGIYDKDNNLLWLDGAIYNVTDQKRAQEQMKKAIKLKSEFISVVSHELRTPLTAIKEGIGIVYDGSAGKINDEQKDFLDTAKRNVDRLARLINNVLDFQKLESGKIEFNFKENDINEIIKEVAKTMEPPAESKGLKIDIDLDNNIKEFSFDKDKIIEVVVNLVNNAIKFTEKGKITMSSSVDKKDIIIGVADTGSGIKKEDISKLFKSFKQLEQINERKTGGTGLGLAISKKIVKKHKGEMWVESEHGKGSTFYFSLPYKHS